jgi:hypothetical protein
MTNAGQERCADLTSCFANGLGVAHDGDSGRSLGHGTAGGAAEGGGGDASIGEEGSGARPAPTSTPVERGKEARPS